MPYTKEEWNAEVRRMWFDAVESVNRWDRGVDRAWFAMRQDASKLRRQKFFARWVRHVRLGALYDAN